MEHELDLTTVLNFAIALAIGALAGTEREKRKESEGEPTIGGLRTFTLIALCGAVSAWLSRGPGVPWIFVVAFLIVGGIVFAGYILGARVRENSLGLTTEVSALAVFLLAGMTIFGHREIAVGLGIVTAAMLAYKQPLHGLVERIGWDDLYAGLRLLIATFIVLPLLPDRTIDPLGAINPYKIWLLVILIASLSLAGYVATRWIGEHRGTILTGLTGGLVSSTAVTLSFARQGRSGAGATALATGILVAWTVMFARVIVELLVVAPRLVPAVLVPLGAMAVVTLGGAGLLYVRGAAGKPAQQVALRNPFSLTAAAKFAAFFTLVLVAVKLAEKYLPAAGFYPVAALAGLTDVDAITLSMAGFVREGGDVGTASTAIAIATITNTLAKGGMVAVLGAAELRKPILLSAAAIVAAGVAAIFVG
jgi:uncharacterized membrane protein (DUF4010 family)